MTEFFKTIKLNIDSNVKEAITDINEIQNKINKNIDFKANLNIDNINKELANLKPLNFENDNNINEAGQSSQNANNSNLDGLNVSNNLAQTLRPLTDTISKFQNFNYQQQGTDNNEFQNFNKFNNQEQNNNDFDNTGHNDETNKQDAQEAQKSNIERNKLLGDLSNTLREIAKLEQLELENTDEFKKLEKIRDDLKKKLGDKGNKDLSGYTFFEKLKEFKKGNYGGLAREGGKNLLQVFKKGFDLVLNSLKNIFGDILGEVVKSVKQLTEYDSESYYFSENAYNQQLEYGLSDAENYALTKTKERLNLSDDEYLIGGYNEARGKKIDEFLELYKKEYDEQKASGFLNNVAKIRENYEKLKNELRETIIKFIAENGETIVAVLKGLFQVLKALFSVVSFFFSKKTDEISVQEAHDNINNTIQKYTYQNTNNNTNKNNFYINNNLTNTREQTASGTLDAYARSNAIFIKNAIK